MQTVQQIGRIPLQKRPVDPSGVHNVVWLAFLSMAILYNFWTIVLRFAISNVENAFEGSFVGWLLADYM